MYFYCFRRKFFFSILSLSCCFSFSQSDAIQNPVVTSVPFLRLAPDARSGSLADIGVASSPDVYSQYSNAAKYPFMNSSSEISISYTPWLNSIIRDVFFSNIAYYNKISERGSLGASLTFFSFGDVEIINREGLFQYSLEPSELAIDVSYGLRLGERFSTSVTWRYIRSDINDTRNNPNFRVGNSFAVDIGTYYRSKLVRKKDKGHRYSIGLVVSNIGPKINYLVTQNNRSNRYFLPANLAIGASYDYILGYDNRLSVLFEADKLLVPILERNPSIQQDGVIESIFNSFSDAPGGFKEELQEFQLALGVEYSFRDQFFLRSGYHYENPNKGHRRFLSFGIGIHYKEFGFDFSYLSSASDVIDPLENALRFSIKYDLASDGGSFNGFE